MGRFTAAAAVFLLSLYFSPVTAAPEAAVTGLEDESAGKTKQDRLSDFSDPFRIWGKGIEGVIEEAYRRSFRTYIIGDRVMNLRMPFAQNNERNTLTDQGWEFLGGGKADPVYLWEIIDGILKTDDFNR